MHIKKVSSYKIINHILLYKELSNYKQKKKLVEYDLILNKVVQSLIFEINFSFTENSNYLLFDPNNSVYDINNKTYINKCFNSIINNIGIIDKDWNGVYSLNNLFLLPEEKQILSEWLPNRIFHIQDQYWCNDTDEDFKLIDADSGEILWTIPQSKVEKPYGYNGLTNIKKVLGIYKGNLWLQLPDSRFLVLDIRDGSIKHELKHDYYIVHERGTFFDREEGIIKVLYYNLYAKYSLDLMEFVEEVDLGIPEIFQVTSMISRPKDKYIYYTAKLNDVSMISNAYGIFDTEKKEVIFQGEEIEVDGHFYQEPQVNDELFTILDSKGNLIIHKLKDILPSQLDRAYL